MKDKHWLVSNFRLPDHALEFRQLDTFTDFVTKVDFDTLQAEIGKREFIIQIAFYGNRRESRSCMTSDWAIGHS